MADHVTLCRLGHRGRAAQGGALGVEGTRRGGRAAGRRLRRVSAPPWRRPPRPRRPSRPLARSSIPAQSPAARDRTRTRSRANTFDRAKWSRVAEQHRKQLPAAAVMPAATPAEHPLHLQPRLRRHEARRRRLRRQATSADPEHDCTRCSPWPGCHTTPSAPWWRAAFRMPAAVDRASVLTPRAPRTLPFCFMKYREPTLRAKRIRQHRGKRRVSVGGEAAGSAGSVAAPPPRSPPSPQDVPAFAVLIALGADGSARLCSCAPHAVCQTWRSPWPGRCWGGGASTRR